MIFYERADVDGPKLSDYVKTKVPSQECTKLKVFIGFSDALRQINLGSAFSGTWHERVRVQKADTLHLSESNSHSYGRSLQLRRLH